MKRPDEGTEEDILPGTNEIGQALAHEIVPLVKKLAKTDQVAVVLCCVWGAEGSERASSVTLANVPDNIIEAVLAVSLHRARHMGADFRGRLPLRTM